MKRRACPAFLYQAQTTDKMTWCCQQWRKWVNEDVTAACTTLVEVYPGGLTGGSSKAPVTLNLGKGVDDIPSTVTLIAATVSSRPVPLPASWNGPVPVSGRC